MASDVADDHKNDETKANEKEGLVAFNAHTASVRYSSIQASVD